MPPVAPEHAKRLDLDHHEQHDTRNSRQHRDRLLVLQHFVHGREIQRSAPSRRRSLASNILPVAPKCKANQGILTRFRNSRDLVIYRLLPRTILCGDAGPYQRKENFLIWVYRSPARRSGLSTGSWGGNKPAPPPTDVKGRAFNFGARQPYRHNGRPSQAAPRYESADCTWRFGRNG